ncbi:glycosyltransferase [Candidatus Uhrbacteria bacterium]|jgi:glycosyltransferase involved in cell wall biosynthesis|nr:glycosyltransferase [Candidatus Uhrbacteria bacterium]
MRSHSLSIVIPALNEEKLLSDLLSSIKKQTVDAEVIVADAKSTDDTKKIAESFGARVVDGGLPSYGRNAGAKVATGDIILFLDADVVLPDENFLSRALNEFATRPFDVATADVIPKSIRRYDRFSFWVYNRYVRAWGSRRAHAPGFFIIIRRALHAKIGGFDERIVFCEDHEYVGRAAKQGQFGFLNSVKIPTSVRRFDKDGRFSIALKFIKAELHLIFRGPILDNSFDYTFDYGSDSTEEK